jgi:hypothetical protein
MAPPCGAIFSINGVRPHLLSPFFAAIFLPALQQIRVKYAVWSSTFVGGAVAPALFIFQ